MTPEPATNLVSSPPCRSLCCGARSAGAQPGELSTAGAGYSALQTAEFRYQQDKFSGEVYRLPRYLLQQRYRDPAADVPVAD